MRRMYGEVTERVSPGGCGLLCMRGGAVHWLRVRRDHRARLCVLAETFEDKRYENFRKGQEELERRRAQLQEQLRKEEEARQAEERAEQERKEKLRYAPTFACLRFAVFCAPSMCPLPSAPWRLGRVLVR